LFNIVFKVLALSDYCFSTQVTASGKIFLRTAYNTSDYERKDEVTGSDNYTEIAPLVAFSKYILPYLPGEKNQLQHHQDLD
jgi:hypothetical protein